MKRGIQMAAQQDTPSGSIINVRVEYQIEDSTDNSIRHGWVKIEDMKVERSFLRFKKEEAKTVHKNLSKLQGASFLKSYFIVKHQNHYWLAVDKIQCSLNIYIEEHLTIWNCSRLDSQYQDIIRGIIIGICELHRQGHTLEGLSIEDILIVNDKPKFAFIRNEYRPRLEGCQDFKYLEDLFKEILDTRDELNHFYKRIRVNSMLELSKLYFHPILMTPMERFFQPVMMDTLARYPHHEKAADARHLLTNDWIKKVEGWYKHIKDYSNNRRPYDRNVWDLFKFVRNAIVHINDYADKREEEVEKDLSTTFPDSFNEIYDLFKPSEIALGSRAPHLESSTDDTENERTCPQSPRRSSKRIRERHLESPTKDREKKKTGPQSPGRSSKSIRERHLESPTKDREKKRTPLQSPERSSKRIRERHLESPTKDREKKRTPEQSPERSSKRIRRDRHLNSRSEPSPPTQMPQPPPSSLHHHQSSRRKSPARQCDRQQTKKGRRFVD